MFVRDFLSNAEYVTVVPVGILITLQYDPNGRLERVIHGATEGDTDVSDEFLKPIQSCNVMPKLLTVKGGRTWIYGVLYTNVLPYLNDNGILPESIYEKLKKDFIKNPDKFVFAAHSAKSLSTVLKGSLATRQWLVAIGFNVLPGMPVSNDALKEDNFANRLESYLGDQPYFDFPLIAGYCAYHNGQSEYYPFNLRMEVVKKISQIIDIHGNIYMNINEGFLVDYNEAVNKYDIKKGSTLLIDPDGMLLNVYKSGLSTVVNKNEAITCPICGNIFHVAFGNQTKCSDPHCNSRLFVQTNQMLSAYNLPNVTYAAYKETTNSIGNNYSVADILNRPEYNYDITVSLPTLLYGIIPRTVIADYQSIVLFCNRCHNSIDNVIYKLSNIGILQEDNDLPEIERLIQWLRDPRNLSDIQKVVDNPNITIGNNTMKFKGDPIFRNLKIFITGDFNHGSDLDIKNIFSSYSGTVVNNINDANVVVIGGSQTNIDGGAIKFAREKGITMIDEYSFFNHYGIDEDLLRAGV